MRDAGHVWVMHNVPPHEPNAEEVAREDVAPGLMILRVRLLGWQLNSFEPGQFIALGLPESAPRCEGAETETTPTAPGALIRRPYSICSNAPLAGELEFYVDLVPGGCLSPRLFALRAGDRLVVGPKATGAFTLADVPGDRDLVLMATGSGLAPFVSMLRSHLSRAGARRIVLVHGVRRSAELGYRAELESMATAHAAFSYVPVISRPREEPAPWGGLSGYVQDTWRSGLIGDLWGRSPTPSSTRVLLCGNPFMIRDVLEMLRQAGYHEHQRHTPGHVHIEKYWAG